MHPACKCHIGEGISLSCPQLLCICKPLCNQPSLQCLLSCRFDLNNIMTVITVACGCPCNHERVPKHNQKKNYYFIQSHSSTDEVRYREKYMLLNLRQWPYREQWPQNIKTKSVFQPLSCCVLGYFVLPVSQSSQSFCRRRCPGLCVYCIILLLLLFLKAPVITAESNCHNLKQPLSFSQNELDFLLLGVRMFRSGKESLVHRFCLFVKRLHFLVVERESPEEGA